MVNHLTVAATTLSQVDPEALAPPTQPGRPAASGALNKRLKTISSRRLRTSVFWGVALVSPWIATLIIVLNRPELRHFSATGLAVTRAEATWLAAWLIAVVGVIASWLIRKTGGSKNRRDVAEAAYETARGTTSEMTADALSLPPQDPRPQPFVSSLLGAEQSALGKRGSAVVAERRSGMRGLIVGTDGRVSTSKLQVALWTGAVLYAFVFLLLAGWHIWDRPQTPTLNSLRDGFAHLAQHPLQPEYLVLLGIPLGAALAAKALIQNKVVAGTLTKTLGVSEGVLPGLGEVVSNDTGSTDLLDTQYAVFNLITLIYFFAAFLGTTVSDPSLGLPSLPPTLLALSGVSAATYVTKKSLETGTVPQVQGVSPRLVIPGVNVYLKVTGSGFCTNGVATASNAVTIGDVPVSADQWSDGEVTVGMPATTTAARALGLSEGSQPLVVTDANGNDSSGFLIQVAYQPAQAAVGASANGQVR